MIRIPIVYAGNRKVFDGMVISVLSVVKYHRDPVDIFLLTMDLTEVNENFVAITESQRAYVEGICKAVNPESTVNLIDVKQFYAETLLNAPNQNNQYTPYTYLRLYVEKIPGMPEKLIYLDTDTVLHGDIAELYNVDLGDAEFGGVRDHYGYHFFGINYLNAGVLLLNLPKIRETGVFRKAVEACGKKEIFLSDQTTINRFAKKKKILHRRFNEQKTMHEDTLIRHFSMTILWFPWFHTQNVKPWQVDRVHDLLHLHEFDDILSDYLERKSAFPD